MVNGLCSSGWYYTFDIYCIVDNTINNSHFFRVTTLDNTSDFGQAYETILCTGLKLRIEPKQILELRVPWQADSIVSNHHFCLQSLKKNALPKGTYKTILQEFLVISDLEINRLTKKTDLSVVFKIL